jgi:hypothetical protein
MNIQELLTKRKEQMDIGTLYFKYKNLPPKAVHKNWMQVGPNATFENSYLNWDKQSLSGLDAIYFKNDNGVWIDLLALYASSANLTNLWLKTIQLENQYRINIKKLLNVEYTDENGVLHNINRFDGLENVAKTTGAVDVLKGLKVDLSWKDYSNYINNEIQPPLQRQEDLFIELKEPNDDIENYLISLNGRLMPYDKVPDNDKIGVIRKGISYVFAEELSKQETTPVNMKPGATASVDEMGTINELKMEVKGLHLFTWQDIRVKKPYEVVTSLTERFVYPKLKKAIVVPKTLIFDVPFNKDDSLLILNGYVIDDHFFTVDKSDPKRVHLDFYKDRALKIFLSLDLSPKYDDDGNIIPETAVIIDNDHNRLITELYESIGIAYMPDWDKKIVTNPTGRIATLLSYDKFHMIKFEAKEIGKKVVLRKDRNFLTNQPYYRDMTFKKVRFNDLILIDGKYIPYIFINRNMISFMDLETITNAHDIYKLDVTIENSMS